jgi:hypothetical protein
MPASSLRNHAIDDTELIRQRVYQIAFELLKREFGAKAHFWPRPKLDEGMVPKAYAFDFYWKKGNVALAIVGTDKSAAIPTVGGSIPIADVRSIPGFYGPRCPQVVVVSYELVLSAPQEFLRQVRDVLIASGKYPRLL